MDVETELTEAPEEGTTPELDAQEPEQEAQEQENPQEALILGKFRSQADLEAAYANLEREHTRTRQELSERARQEPQQPSEDPEQAELLRLYETAGRRAARQAKALGYDPADESDRPQIEALRDAIYQDLWEDRQERAQLLDAVNRQVAATVGPPRVTQALARELAAVGITGADPNAVLEAAGIDPATFATLQPQQQQAALGSIARMAALFSGKTAQPSRTPAQAPAVGPSAPPGTPRRTGADNQRIAALRAIGFTDEQIKASDGYAKGGK